MEQFGIIIDEEYFTSFIGSTDKYMFEVLKEKYKLSTSIDDFLLLNKQTKQELLKIEPYPAIPFIKELIENLHEHGMKFSNCILLADGINY